MSYFFLLHGQRLFSYSVRHNLVIAEPDEVSEQPSTWLDPCPLNFNMIGKLSYDNT